jgi:hypothetical protein
MSLTTQKNAWLAEKGFTIALDAPATSALAVNGIIPAGSIYPANDATAKGIVVNDTELAEKQGLALMIKGVAYSNKLPAIPAAAAITALKANGLLFVNNGAVL